MLTSDYLQLLNGKKLSKDYRNCLEEFINYIITNNFDNIETILLYGGIVRDLKVFDDWSDIDIIVIFKDITNRNASDLAQILQRLETKYSIRIDLTQISLKELTDKSLIRCCLNSEVINALSMRKNVSIIVFGNIPSFDFTQEQERQAAIFYIINTLGLFRRYIVEVLYRGNIEEHIKADLRRIIRWTFSIVRASLRLFGIYTHPYENSLPFVNQIFPEIDTSLLKQLIHLRENMNKISGADITNILDIFQRVEIFIEKYATLCLERYFDEVENKRKSNQTDYK